MNACPENPSTELHFQGIIDSLEKLESLVQKAGDNLTGRERLVLDRERKKLKNRVVELVREMERSFSDADNRLRRLFEAGRFSKNHDSTAPDPAAEENLVQKSRHLLQLARLGQPDKAYLKALCPDYKLLINRYFHMVQVGGFTSHEARKEVQGNLGETLELIKGRSAYQVA
jgi:hypothetical protein